MQCAWSLSASVARGGDAQVSQTDSHGRPQGLAGERVIHHPAVAPGCGQREVQHPGGSGAPDSSDSSQVGGVGHHRQTQGAHEPRSAHPVSGTQEGLLAERVLVGGLLLLNGGHQ